ncbi:hypothetical protein [Shewanella surugensis]|uniref:Uncharacterized protein n=1 Tax=Shewanella surugensis TaxID=212020 RepID=A0ABT0LHG8_9GAMM|nr:hypothetical protein [Shewanella surugensis]MCL1127157.1 hypothetical protein [Shewanella surugensis]
MMFNPESVVTRAIVSSVIFTLVLTLSVSGRVMAVANPVESPQSTDMVSSILSPSDLFVSQAAGDSVSWSKTKDLLALTATSTTPVLPLFLNAAVTAEDGQMVTILQLLLIAPSNMAGNRLNNLLGINSLLIFIELIYSPPM